MRKIKFRAWDAYNRVMISPYCELMYNRFWVADLTNTPYQTPISVMQFTGLHDKNGNEIYEGDMVHWKDGSKNEKHWRNGFVFYQSDKCCYAVEITNCGTLEKGYVFGSNFYEWRLDNDLEIIGNIYENPELLK